MPKDDIEIKGFVGLFATAGEEDIPPGGARYVDGADLKTSVGKFRGLPKDIQVANLTPQLNGWILTQNGKTAVCYAEIEAKIYVIEGLPDSPTIVAEFGAVGDFGGGVSDGSAVRIALGKGNAPQWVGNINGVWTAESAYILQPTQTLGWDIVFTAWMPGEGGGYTEDLPKYPFKANVIYRWTLAAIYDNAQISPIANFFAEAPTVQTEYKDYATLTITIPASLSGRIKAFEIYRSESGVTRDVVLDERARGGVRNDPDLVSGDRTRGGGDRHPGTRVVQTIDDQTFGPYLRVTAVEIADDTTPDEATRTSGWLNPTQYILYDDGSLGISFNERAGFSETLDNQSLRYDLAARIENTSFVAVVDIAGVDDPESAYMIMRSEPFRFDTFNWHSNWYRMEHTPVAMHSFMGRIWLFSEGATHVMLPELGDPEILDGIGAAGRTAMASSDKGMMVAGTRQVWFHNRQEIKAIGDRIMEMWIREDADPGLPQGGAEFGYKYLDSVPIVMYDARQDVFLLFCSVKNPQNLRASHLFVYYHDLDQWSHVAFGVGGTSNIFFDGFTSNDGVAMIARRAYLSPTHTELYKMFDSNERRGVVFRGNTFKEGSRKQTFYNAIVNGDEPLEFFYEENGDGTENQVAFTSVEGVHEGVINSSPRNGVGTTWKDVNRFTYGFKLASNKKLDSITLQRLVEEIV